MRAVYPCDPKQVSDACVDALARRLEDVTGIALGAKYRTTYLSDAFVRTIGTPERRAIVGDILAGDGGELRWSVDQRIAPPFHSCRSSCALAANSLGPWRLSTAGLRLTGFAAPHQRFEHLTFEHSFRRDCRGRPPNLDVFVKGSTCVAIESKMLEYLSSKPADFRPAYDLVAEDTSPGWRHRFDELRREPTAYRWLDAGQLVKHYLGAKRFAGTKRPVLLIYVYWEPTDADESPLFAEHRAEVSRFSEGLDDGCVAFGSSSWARLWASLPASPTSREHVEVLRERYEVAAFGD